MAKIPEEKIKNYIEKVREHGDDYLKAGKDTGLWLKVPKYESMAKIIDSVLAKAQTAFGRPKNNPIILDIGGIPGFGYVYTKSLGVKGDYQIREFKRSDTVDDTMSNIGGKQEKIIPGNVIGGLSIDSDRFFTDPRPDIIIIQPRVEKANVKPGTLKRKIVEIIGKLKTTHPVPYIIATIGDTRVFEDGLHVGEIEEMDLEFLFGGQEKMSIFVATYDPKNKKISPQSIKIRGIIAPSDPSLANPHEGEEEIQGIESPKITRVDVILEKEELKEPVDFRTTPGKYPRYLSDFTGHVLLDVDKAVSASVSKLITIGISGIKELEKKMVPGKELPDSPIRDRLLKFREENKPIIPTLIPYSLLGNIDISF